MTDPRPPIPLSLLVSLARMQRELPYSLRGACSWPIETSFRIERGPRVNCSSLSASILVEAARLVWGHPVDRYTITAHRLWTIQTADIWGPLTAARAMGMHVPYTYDVHLCQGWRDALNLSRGGHTWIEVRRVGAEPRIIDAGPGRPSGHAVRLLSPRPASWRWDREHSVRLHVNEEA